MKPTTVFYSWQSDLPRDVTNLHRKAIQDAINKYNEETTELMQYDDATRDEVGTINILEKIFEKISSCDIFIADVSTINHLSSGERKVPNPNVCIELGFAASVVGWNRIILIFNDEFGDFKSDLPFDMPKSRLFHFKIKDKADKNGLGQLRTIIMDGITSIVKRNPPYGDKYAISEYKLKRNRDVTNIKALFSNFIYRFSGSDMALFNQFPEYFGATEINKIETTYRFGEPLVSLSSHFIQRNKAQIQKDIHSFSSEMKTELEFYSYDRRDYCNTIGQLVASIPSDKSIFLLGRYSFDDYYLSFMYQSIKEGNRFFYVIGERKIEFLTVHKSKGLEADYVILLQCNKDTYGFPSLVSDDPVLKYVLTKSDQFPYGEERRLFYVAITRAKMKTLVLYDKRFPSVFVDEFLHPERVSEENYVKHPNANKRWTRGADQFLLKLHDEGKSVKYIAAKMGRSQTSIVMRLNKLTQ